MLSVKEAIYIVNPYFGDVRKWVNLTFSCDCGREITVSTEAWKEKLSTDDHKTMVYFRCKVCNSICDIFKERFKWKKHKLLPFEKKI